MHSFVPSLLLVALASTAAGLPNFRGPVNFKRDSPNSIPFPTGTDIPAFGDSDFKASQTGHQGAFGTGLAHGTGSHTRHHHHLTGTGDHHSASATLAARQLSDGGSSFTGSFPTSFPMPTGTGGIPGGGFPAGTGFGGGIPTGCGGQYSHSGSQSGVFASSTGVQNFKQNFPSGAAGASGGFPSMSLPSGTGFGNGEPTGGFGMGSECASPTGGSGHAGQGQQSYSSHSESASATGNTRNFPRQFPSGSAGPSSGFSSMSVPTGTGFGGDAPTGGFGMGSGSASPTGGFGQGGQQHAQETGMGFGGSFPGGTGFPSGPSGGFPTGGFLVPTGSGTGIPFPTTFQTSVVAPSSATP